MLSTLIDDLKSTSRPTEKEETLKKHTCLLLTFLLERAFNPHVHFNVKIKQDEIPPPGEGRIESYQREIFTCLKECCQVKSSRKNKERLLPLMEKLDAGSQALLWGVVDKNLHCGLSTKGALKVFPSLVTLFEVQTAHKLVLDKKYRAKKYLWSYKYDGIRGVALREFDKWTLYHRKGRKMLTGDHILPELEYLYKKYGTTFADGEFYTHGEIFEDIQGAVMSPKKGASGQDYHCFLLGEAEDFRAQRVGKIILNFEETDCIKKAYQGEVDTADIKEELALGLEDIDEFMKSDAILADAVREGFEGIMLRDPDNLYDYKRSNNLLKVKLMDTDDCVVLDVIGDTFPIIEDGEHTEIYTLTKLLVKQPNGVTCHVGTGFDLPFRQFWWRHREDLKGQVVECMHQGYGRKGRMRFPVFNKRIRTDL